MYSVSADYLTAIAKNARAHKLKGVVGLNRNFDGDDVIKGSFQIRNQLCPATEIILGGVYIGELTMVFSTDFAQSMNIRGAWKGVTVTPQIGVELADGTFEYIPMGVFTIEDAKWTNAGLQVTAYDNMSKFDKPFGNVQSSGTVYDFLNLACIKCGVNLGMSAMECNALTNGTEILGIYPDDSMETWRDMISKVAQVACCFATMDRSGALVLRPLPAKTDVTITIGANARYSTSFCDYTSFYDTISVVDMKNETTRTYTNDNSGGLTMNLGSNPFLQYGTAETVSRIRQAIADGLEDFAAVPYSVSILPNPALDLGDLIEFTGGIGLGALGAVMAFTQKVDSSTLEGYGENPALADARSKTDKEISGLLGKTQENEVIIYTYENAQAYSLADQTETDIIEIKFATVTPKTVQLFHEIKLDVEAVDPTEPVECIVHYYLDGDEVSYQPITSWDNDGYHLLNLMYFLETLADGQAYDWKVALEMSNGTATIAVDDARATLFGQGLAAVDAWAGEVKVEDETYTLTLHGWMEFNYEEGSVSTPTKTPTTVSIADDTYSLILGGWMQFNYEEGQVEANTYKVVTGFITEGGDSLITESDDYLIAEIDEEES